MNEPIQITDPLAHDWDARGKRAQAKQREQQVEAFSGEHLPLSRLEPILVSLAQDVQGILAGIVDQCRAAGLEPALVGAVQEIIADALRQVAGCLDGIAESAVAAVEDVEAAVDALPDPLAALSGPTERKAARKPRGLGKPKHGGQARK